MSERSRIRSLAAIFAGVNGAGVRTSIGDDAAVLMPPPGELVVTVDEQVEGTHFRREWLALEDVGYRSTIAAASDVAAMGAAPWVILAALVLPATMSDAEVDKLARGQRAASLELGAPIVGGNLARGPALTIATTVLGVLGPDEHAVTRSGAAPGDGLWLAGMVGLAAAGVRALLADVPADAEALFAWRRPRALVAEGRRMRGIAHAAVDISDGLAGDAAHLARASGVKAVFDGAAVDALASHPAIARAAATLGVPKRDIVLAGGEDYALLCASPGAIAGFVRIGECAVGEGVVVRDGGVDVAVERGFDHFE
ncbi:thiamine-phosphate kinase [soil metagenome]